MRQRGFSLIELMVALVILVLLVLAAMPSLGTWLDNTRIRNEGESLIAGMQTARGEAVRRNMNVSFWLVQLPSGNGALANDCSLNGSSGSWMVSVSSPDSHCADAPSTTNAPMIVVGRPMGADSGVVSVNALQSDNSTAGTTITFNGFGRVSNSDSITRIDLDGTGGSTYRKLRVVISPTGSVRLCDPAVSSSTDPRKC